MNFATNLARRIALATALAGATLVAASAPGLAQAPQQQSGPPTVSDQQTTGSWTVRCYHGGLPCDITQATIERTHKMMVASISIIYIPQKNAYFGRFLLPLGVSFDQGMGLSIGSFQAQNLKFRICERDGCFITGVLPQRLIDAMSDPATPKGAISATFIDGRKFQLPIVLDGFSDGLELLKKWAAEKGPTAEKAKK